MKFPREKFRAGTRTAQAFTLAAAIVGPAACAPDLDAGEWICTSTSSTSRRDDETTPIPSPWSTGFEDGFCDYTASAGFCYGDSDASYSLVTSPVRSGRHAAAFRVRTDVPDAGQARCVLEGVLPTAAYYGAWYFVPARARNSALWNLIHFQGGTRAGLHGLWDVSLVNGNDGELELVVFDFLSGTVRRPRTRTPVPIGSWFHVEFYLERAADPTGSVALYQDGRQLLSATNLVTDDSSWGQWYVGNLASELTPPEITLYVDDVTIRSDR